MIKKKVVVKVSRKMNLTLREMIKPKRRRRVRRARKERKRRERRRIKRQLHPLQLQTARLRQIALLKSTQLLLPTLPKMQQLLCKQQQILPKML